MNNDETILVEFPNCDGKIAVGFLDWLDDEDKKNLTSLITSEKEVFNGLARG